MKLFFISLHVCYFEREFTLLFSVGEIPFIYNDTRGTDNKLRPLDYLARRVPKRLLPHYSKLLSPRAIVRGVMIGMIGDDTYS